jgi:hypothetical protein
VGDRHPSSTRPGTTSRRTFGVRRHSHGATADLAGWASRGTTLSASDGPPAGSTPQATCSLGITGSGVACVPPSAACAAAPNASKQFSRGSGERWCRSTEYRGASDWRSTGLEVGGFESLRARSGLKAATRETLAADRIASCRLTFRAGVSRDSGTCPGAMTCQTAGPGASAEAVQAPPRKHLHAAKTELRSRRAGHAGTRKLDSGHEAPDFCVGCVATARTVPLGTGAGIRHDPDDARGESRG